MKDLTDPTNKDTVPAMLTPGEFVLNKEASQMYAPLIEQMNNHGLQQRHMENKNMGGMIPQYNTGGLVDFLKEHEGYRDKAYQDQAGVWTIGYGRTRNPDGSPIKPDQTTNKEEEDTWLSKRAKTDRSATQAYGKKHGYDWNDNQIDALSSFRYNIGNLDQLTDGGTRGTEEIVQMLPAYNKAGGKVSAGLKNRRQAELDLFHGGDQSVPEMRQPPPRQRQPLQFAAAANPQSFDDAFAQARSAQGAGGVFEHGGQQYTTDRADDDLQRNNGGSIPHYNIGGWLSNLFSPDDERQRELAATAQRFGNLDAAAAQGAAMGTNPVIPRPQPDLPIPNSDESLLQGSSQSVDQAQGQQVPQFTGEFDANNQPIMANVPYNEIPFDPAYDRPIEPYNPAADINTALDNAGQASYEEPETYTTPEGEYGGPIPQQTAAPGNPLGDQFAGYADYTPEEFVEEAEEFNTNEIPETPEDIADSTFQNPDATPEELKAAQTVYNADATDDAKAAATAKLTGEDLPKPTTQEKKAATTETVAAITEQTSPEEVAASEEMVKKAGGSDGVEAAGQQAAKSDPKAMDGAKNDVKEAFGDLFDTKELVRAAVLYLGARATGMSGGQALAFAGRGYIGRIDAKQSTYQKVATAGKHTPESLRAYKESNDPTDLVPLGVSPTATGNFSTKYTKSGKPVIVQEMKVGKNTILVDESGKQVNGYALENESPKDRTARRKSSTAEIKNQLTEMRKTFDTFKTDKGESSKTDILPSTSAGKIAEWAIDNGVEPEDVSGLVESAYHDALNDKRQDGSRSRDLVPYLNQLVIRQQVPGNEQAFQAKEGQGYVNAKKLNILNDAAANVLKGMGKEGNVSDLSNLFYTEALQDWNDLGKDDKAQWQKRALGDENGFYLFASDMITQAM